MNSTRAKKRDTIKSTHRGTRTSARSASRTGKASETQTMIIENVLAGFGAAVVVAALITLVNHEALNMYQSYSLIGVGALIALGFVLTGINSNGIMRIGIGCYLALVTILATIPSELIWFACGLIWAVVTGTLLSIRFGLDEIVLWDIAYNQGVKEGALTIPEIGKLNQRQRKHFMHACEVRNITTQPEMLSLLREMYGE